MLILTRKEGQGVVIGGHTRVTVNDIRGRQVRLGFDTPLGTPVLREERSEELMRWSLKFPSFYRARYKADGNVAGYALSLPVIESTRYFYEEVSDYSDIAPGDHPVELHIFSSEGEAFAMAKGLDVGSRSHMSHVVEGRQGRWIVLVDLGPDAWHSRTPAFEVYNYTVERHGTAA